MAGKRQYEMLGILLNEGDKSFNELHYQCYGTYGSIYNRVKVMLEKGWIEKIPCPVGKGISAVRYAATEDGLLVYRLRHGFPMNKGIPSARAASG